MKRQRKAVKTSESVASIINRHRMESEFWKPKVLETHKKTYIQSEPVRYIERKVAQL